MISHRPFPSSSSFVAACVAVLMGAFALALGLQTMLESEAVATTLMSSGLWQEVVRALGGRTVWMAPGVQRAELEFGHIAALAMGLAAVSWWGGAGCLAGGRSGNLWHALAEWGLKGWLWWLLPGVWALLHAVPSDAAIAVLWGTTPMWVSLTLAGWSAMFFALRFPQTADKDASAEATGSRRPRWPVWVVSAMAVYFVVFAMMNGQLYRGLLIPHGDSAMYEEHLWNLTHGKGFRSYLDQGLFLGEHIQVIHLLLIPLHALWPSHLLLELCESAALALGALPVFWLARRHTGSKRVAALLACAYLLYFPLQFLDIAIDLKTFRPIALGVPVLLFALDRLERGAWKSAALLLVLALSAKEDYALVMAPLGVWLAAQRGIPRKQRAYGVTLAVLAAAYLVLATRVVIPWFRGGDEVHYARYFSRFGDSLREIAWNMLSDPGLLFGELFTGQFVIYTLAILVPLGGLPLLSPGRLVVGLPLFGLLCLNEIAQDPRHHFHAPLVPIVFWAAAAGLKNVDRLQKVIGGLRMKLSRSPATEGEATSWRAFAGHFVWTSALATGLFYSLSPAGVAFWDPHSEYYWRTLYIPGPRAELFEKVFEKIPRDARVASTDFVHTRFTHHERSYDYSNYARKVSDYELRVPEDTDYIVIDTQHRYSEIQSPEQVREYREHPERWELLPDVTNGYFIVLKRVR